MKPGDRVRVKKHGVVKEVGLSGLLYVEWKEGGLHADWMRPSELEVIENEPAPARGKDT